MDPVPLTVLVVEDNDEMRAFLRKQLSDHYRVRVAEDGNRAWQQVREKPPDLLVSDTEMPGTSGTVLCRRVKQAEEVPSIPVILLAEETRPSTDASGTRADEVLSKPFAMAELREAIRRYVPPDEFSPLSDVEEPNEFLKTVLRTIERQLHDPAFAVEDLADEVSLSRRHLTRRLKTLAYTTPAALIRDRRIERAKTHLADNPSTVAEVGRAVGFRSASHFSQVFREEVGCPPSTYREKHGS